MKLSFLFGVMLLVAISCREDDKPMTAKEHSHSLVGKWLYTERGYSPGGGYITEDVSLVPAQTIRFLPDLTLQTNITGLIEYRYYKVSEDVTTKTLVLALFKENPDDRLSRSAEASSYFISWEGEVLKLHQQGCIEGCHMGFKRKLTGTADE